MINDLVTFEDAMNDWALLQSRNIIGSGDDPGREGEVPDKKHKRFYLFDGTEDDGAFMTRFYRYRNDSRQFDTEFKPEDLARAGEIMDRILAEKAERLGVDLEPARSVVATALAKKLGELAEKAGMSAINPAEEEFQSRLSSLSAVEIDDMVYNVLYGTYLAGRLGKKLMFELTDLDSTSCFILSGGGLRLMTLVMPCTSEPGNRSGRIVCTIGPGASREFVFDSDEKLEGFDLESIYGLCENCMDLSGRRIQEIFVKHLNGVGCTCRDILDVENLLTGLGMDLDKFVPKRYGEEDVRMELCKETLCLIAAENYIRNRWFNTDTSYYGAGCSIGTCFDTGENSFSYDSWGGNPPGTLRTGKALNIAPFRTKHYDDLTYPDIEFRFGVIGDVFELYVSGLTMRTTPARGLESIIRLDYGKLVDEVGEVLGKVSLDRKNLDNFFDLEVGL